MSIDQAAPIDQNPDEYLAGRAAAGAQQGVVDVTRLAKVSV